MRYLCFFLYCATSAALGGLIIPATAGVNLDLQLIAPANVEAFFLTDLNVSGEAPSAEVFRATITSDLLATSCLLTFIMRNMSTEIIRAESNRFNLASGTTLINNLDLTNAGSPYKLNNYEVGSTAEATKQKLMQTGYFPSDTYVIRLEISQADAQKTLLAADEFSVVLTNPFEIFLVLPAGDPGFPALQSGTTPLFTWKSTASQFLLKVCEQTGSGSDPESIMQSRPHYETDRSSPLPSQSFLYPSSGVRPLEPGHTYYWQVTTLVQTSSGLKEYPSSIGAFTIAAQELDFTRQRILHALEYILGESYPAVINELSGFQPKGVLLRDGTPISLEEFEDLGHRFLSGQFQTKAIRTE